MQRLSAAKVALLLSEDLTRVHIDQVRKDLLVEAVAR